MLALAFCLIVCLFVCLFVCFCLFAFVKFNHDRYFYTPKGYCSSDTMGWYDGGLCLAA